MSDPQPPHIPPFRPIEPPPFRPYEAGNPPPLEKIPAQSPKQGTKKAGPIGGAIAALAALAAKFKFALLGLFKLAPFLKTGATMLFAMWGYAWYWGWPFAAGFVLLILVHECGHLLAARMFGLKVGVPVFIPFMGAVIALKEAPRNAWVEAWVGIGGPMLGTLGAAFCQVLFVLTHQTIFCALALSGFYLNLFNLIPVSPLDGGRIVTALSPWLWLVGLVIVGAMLFVHLDIILVIILALGIYRFISMLRSKTEEEKRYFELESSQRLIMGAYYFGLIAILVLGMRYVYIEVPVEY